MDGTIVECNTAYGGSRAETAMHYQVAEDHGFTAHDIGILASKDPVALDQACVDLVYAAEDSASLIERIESRNGLLTLEHAEEIGLGSRSYTLVSIDE